jgi:hypothetical protein
MELSAFRRGARRSRGRGIKLGSKGLLRTSPKVAMRMGGRASPLKRSPFWQQQLQDRFDPEVPHPHHLPPSSHERVIWTAPPAMFLDPDMTHGIGATGLGLHTCSELRAQRRTNSGSSRARGGSAFYFELPAWASRVRSRGRARPSRPERPAPRAARPGLSPRARAARGRRGRSLKRCRPPR